MPDFNSQKAKDDYRENIAKKKALEREQAAKEAKLEERAARAEERAERSIRQNRTLLIATVILGVLTLAVELLSNLDRILANLKLLQGS